MNILGLHFGHDGAVAMVCDGEPRIVLLTERLTRIKHATGIDRAMIDRALREAGLTLADIDFCAVTSTQTTPLIFSRKDELAMERVEIPDHAAIASPITQQDHARQKVWVGRETFQSSLNTWLSRRPTTDAALRLSINRDALGDLNVQMPPENTICPWPQMDGIAPAMAIVPSAANLRAALQTPESRLLFHCPITMTISGRKIAGIFLDHHAAHAADVYYRSGQASSLILTYDGATAPRSGALVCLAQGERIVPVSRPGMWLGGFYNLVANAVGLSYDAGKLMGLAPYGTPRFFSADFIGTADALKAESAVDVARRWLERATDEAHKLGYDMTAFGDRAKILAPINADLAASAHQTFEENVVAVVRDFTTAAREGGIAVDALSLAGGCALSCPTNSRLWQQENLPVFVGPSCDDTGLAVGASLWLYHNILGKPLLARDRDEPTSPYLGSEIRAEDIARALAASRDDIVVEDLSGGAPRAAAADLADDRVIGWFEGRSEIGPRALGHRSLLADPRKAFNWERVNKIKGREGWRPFAPAVLKEHAAAHFSDMPLPSPYMLFTGKVRDPGSLPAITHVDGTARVQTVSAKTGGYHALLSAFNDTTACPVVMNTSLNGPREPIVETPDEALRFLVTSDCDVLYMGGHRVTKRRA